MQKGTCIWEVYKILELFSMSLINVVKSIHSLKLLKFTYFLNLIAIETMTTEMAKSRPQHIPIIKYAVLSFAVVTITTGTEKNQAFC